MSQITFLHLNSSSNQALLKQSLRSVNISPEAALPKLIARILKSGTPSFDLCLLVISRALYSELRFKLSRLLCAIKSVGIWLNIALLRLLRGLRCTPILCLLVHMSVFLVVAILSSQLVQMIQCKGFKYPTSLFLNIRIKFLIQSLLLIIVIGKFLVLNFDEHIQSLQLLLFL